MPYGTAHRQGVPQLQTKFDENQKLEHHNMRAPRARKSAKFQRARAEELVLLVFFERAGGQAPQLWEAWPGARARARALSRNQNCKITTFLLVNFQNDHGKSCSVSRDWQPPQISAQFVPISQSYDQKPDFQIVRSASLFKQGMPIIQKSQFYYPESRVSNTKCHVR